MLVKSIVLCRPVLKSQFDLVHIDGVECLKYTEDLSTKTNQGSLKHEHLNAKSSVAYSCKVKDRCLVYLYEKYAAMLLDTCMDTAFYLQSRSQKQIQMGKGWYKDKAIGENTLSKVVRRVTNATELEGFFTNHSLKALCATTLHNDRSDCRKDRPLITSN